MLSAPEEAVESGIRLLIGQENHLSKLSVKMVKSSTRTKSSAPYPLVYSRKIQTFLIRHYLKKSKKVRINWCLELSTKFSFHMTSHSWTQRYQKSSHYGTGLMKKKFRWRKGGSEKFIPFVKVDHHKNLLLSLWHLILKLILVSETVLIAWICGEEAKFMESLKMNVVADACTMVLKKFLADPYIPKPKSCLL